MCEFDDGPIGTWTGGGRARITGYRVARLVGEDGSFGLPATVRLEDGRDGHAWLREVVPFPDHQQFRYGCIRGVLEYTWWACAEGGWNGNANFSSGRLFVDNMGGESGILVLGREHSYGVLESNDPHREYDASAAIAMAPVWARSGLEELCREQKERTTGDPTAIFWTEGDRLAAAEPFHMIYGYGLETISGALLDDDGWRIYVEESYGGLMTPAVAQDIIDIAGEYARTGKPVRPSAEVMARVFPEDAPGREDALEGITDGETYIEMLTV